MTVKWLEANENSEGVKTIAFAEEGGLNKIVGYNGILKGEKVIFDNKVYTIVMVSRLGDFGLSETGELPYVIRVSPKDVTRL